MTQTDYNSYTMSIVDEIIDMPYLCGGYTQADWNIINGAMFDREFYDDYLDTPQERANYIEWVTKPYWA